MPLSIDLTHPIHDTMPVYPGSAQPKIVTGSTIERDGFLEKRITVDSHTGTHMDAPAHLLAGGNHLDDYEISRFHGTAIVAHLDAHKGPSIDLDVLAPFEAQLNTANFLLIHTGWSCHWGTPRYFKGFPTLTPAAAEWVARAGLSGIGFDAISADRTDTLSYPIHKILLEADILIVENLTRLDRLPEVPFEFACFPLYVHRADGAPVRAVAFQR